MHSGTTIVDFGGYPSQRFMDYVAKIHHSDQLRQRHRKMSSTKYLSVS